MVRKAGDGRDVGTSDSRDSCMYIEKKNVLDSGRNERKEKEEETMSKSNTVLPRLARQRGA